MSDLVLDVRIDGFSEPVGRLVRSDAQAIAFAYDDAYARAADAVPVSLSLPLTDKPYGDQATRTFFNNMFQEQDAPITRVMERENIARDDIAGLLLHLGKDCPGAISVLPTGAPPAKVPGDLATDYRRFTDTELAAVVTALHERRRLPDNVNDPSPLAGVQSKIGVTILPDGSIAEPKRGTGAPTTHILKVPGRSALSDSKLEEATMLLSAACDFATASVQCQTIAGIEVLIVERFDRRRDNTGRIVRLHQEDFAQALGLPPSLKYERYGETTRIYDAASIGRLLKKSAAAAVDRSTFVRATLFDLLTGNTDGHAKNHALLHLGRNTIRLAPRYDLLPTRLDPSLSDELSYRIGNASTLDTLTREDLIAFLGVLGIKRKAAERLLTAQLSTLTASLARAMDAFDQANLRRYANLIASNARVLLPMFDLTTPTQMADRDAFIAKGGGWANS